MLGLVTYSNGVQAAGEEAGGLVAAVLGLKRNHVDGARVFET